MCSLPSHSQPFFRPELRSLATALAVNRQHRRHCARWPGLSSGAVMGLVVVAAGQGSEDPRCGAPRARVSRPFFTLGHLGRVGFGWVRGIGLGLLGLVLVVIGFLGPGLEVVNSFQDRQMADSTSALMRRIYQLLQTIDQWSIRHVPRKRKQMVDSIVKMISDRIIEVQVFEDEPKQLEAGLYVNKVNGF
ncbi:hypothetical protein Gohar_012979 [Gossypium harknessii]|uniref:Uncharacterized protein n=1 Tax=Gossypium harknessii TaxID=34285 RepID=A0A7J9H143_9ROSI|nr:hypothetical protein [Gossypium harknessii]